MEGVRLINLTPHEITVYTDRGAVSIPPSGQVARVSVTSIEVARIGGIPINRVEYGEVEGLPEPQPNTYYIVSQLVLQALRSAGVSRQDILAPDTSPSSAVRDSEGRIIGVKALLTL